MAFITSRKHAARSLPSRLSQTTAALALMAVPAAFAQAPAEAPTPPSPSAKAPDSTLPTVTVTAPREDGVKATHSASPKFTQPLVDTPQTITVIKKELLLQQGATSLREALRNTPGITFQMGENGNSQTGDSVFMRGFDTQQSIFVDGIRDIGTVSRDVFNLEQVEVVKGPAGADIGRGSPTGYINLSTKVPTLQNATAGSVSIGSGDHKRATIDVNRAVPALGEGTAVRLNLMATDSGKVRRNAVEDQSFAFAPSLALGLNSPTRTYLYYLHVDQKNRPDGGIPAFGLSGFGLSADHLTALNASGQSAAAPNPRNYYGALSDFERVKADMFTVRVENDLTPAVTLRNTSRIGRTHQRYELTGLGTVNVGNSTTNSSTGVVTPPPAGVLANDPSTWIVGRNRQGKDQSNLILTNQTNLTGDFQLGGLTHSVAAGLEVSYEEQSNISFSGVGSTTSANLYNPSVNESFARLTPTGATTSGNTTTAAAYLFDTLKVNDSLQLNAGLRFEKYRTRSNNVSLSTATAQPTLPVGTLIPTNLAKSGDLLTWKAGAVWKPNADGSVYLSYATSQKPPGSDSFSLNASATNANSPNLDPAEASNIELGTKWELLDKRLALTAAIFQAVTKNDVVDTDLVTGAPLQTGKKTVKGIELGAAGMLTANWQLSAGLAALDTEINATTRNNTATQQGQSLAWSPKLTFTSWTSYRLPFGLTVAGGARYSDSALRNSNAATAAGTVTGLPKVPSYWVFDAMASYEVNKNFSLQFNVENLTDKFYIQSVNNNGARYALGAPRAAKLTANLKF